MGKIQNVERKILDNSSKIREAKIKRAWSYAEPTQFGAEELAELARDGPMGQRIKGNVSRIILRAKDGIVDITHHGVSVRKSWRR